MLPIFAVSSESATFAVPIGKSWYAALITVVFRINMLLLNNGSGRQYVCP